MAAARTSGDGKEKEPLLFCREAHVCGTSIEAQYYAPEGDIDKGGRISTKPICCHCYADSHLVRDKDVEVLKERRGRG